MRLFLFAICISVSQFCAAQAPGYMGKKFAVKYDPAFYLSFIDLQDLSEDAPKFGIHWRHDITATYVVGRSVSVGLSYKYLPTRYYQMSEINNEEKDPVTGDYYYVGFSGDMRRNTNCIGAIVQNFSYKKRGSIAPVGRFVSFELLRATNSFKTISFNDNAEELGYGRLIPIEEIHEEPEVDPLWILIFGSGSQQVVQDKFLLEFGFEVGISFTSEFISVFNARYNKTNLDFSNSSDVEEYFRDSLCGPFFVNFTLGGGYLFGR